jgi:hypothetical protein
VPDGDEVQRRVLASHTQGLCQPLIIERPDRDSGQLEGHRLQQHVLRDVACLKVDLATATVLHFFRVRA